MKTQEQILKEIDKRKERLIQTQVMGNENEEIIHESFIEALEWVLKEEK